MAVEEGHGPRPSATGPSPGPLAGLRSLFADPAYRGYWIGSSLFGVSIWVFITAMGWTALELTDSALRVSLVNVVYFLPMFLLAVPSGVLADLVDRRRNVVVSRGASAVLVAAMTFMAATGTLTYAWLCVFAAGVGLSVITELAARQALVAQIVPPTRLVGAAALTNFQGGLARVLGPLLAGWLLDHTGHGGGYALFVACNVAVVLAFLRVRASPLPQPPRRTPWRDLLDGFGYLAGHRDAAAIVALSVSTGTIGWLYLALLPVAARDMLDGDAVTLGALSTAVGLGSLPGALVLGVRVGVRHEGRLYVASMTTWGAGIAAFGLSRTLPVALVALALTGLGFGMQTILTKSLLLRIVEPTYHGRVMGTLMLTYGANVIGTLGGGWIAESVGTPAAVTGSGLGITALSALAVARRPQLLRL